MRTARTSCADVERHAVLTLRQANTNTQHYEQHYHLTHDITNTPHIAFTSQGRAANSAFFSHACTWHDAMHLKLFRNGGLSCLPCFPCFEIPNLCASTGFYGVIISHPHRRMRRRKAQLSFTNICSSSFATDKPRYSQACTSSTFPSEEFLQYGMFYLAGYRGEEAEWIEKVS